MFGKSKIKVLFVSHSAEFLGAEQSLLDILKNLNRNLFEPYLLCPECGILEDKAQTLGIATFKTIYKTWVSTKHFSPRHFFYIPVNIFGIFRIIWMIKKIGADIVYTNTCTVISGAIAAKICRKPHIWHIHETIENKKHAFKFFFWTKPIFLAIQYLSRHIVVNSIATKHLFPSYCWHNISVVYNGFDVSSYALDSGIDTNLREKHKISKVERVVAVIGNINELKGQKNAILAMSFLRGKGFKLVMAGAFSNRKYEKELYEIINLHKTTDAIIFMGFKQDVTDVYAIADILLVPSEVESFGRVIVEAMLSGIPVIASRVGGIPEIIEDGVNGVLLKSREPEDIANAIIAVAISSDKTKRYVQKAHELAIERFSMKTMITNIEKILCSAV